MMKLMGYKRITVAQHQRALLLTDGVLTDILGPGVHQWLDLSGRLQAEVHDLTGAELVHPQAQVYRNGAAALWDAHVLTVQTAADEAALIVLDGQPAALVPPGSQRFYWKGPVRVEVERIGLGADPALAPALLARLRPPAAAPGGDWDGGRVPGPCRRPADTADGRGERAPLPGGGAGPARGSAARGRSAAAHAGAGPARVLELRP
jgi:hypothetical protein